MKKKILIPLLMAVALAGCDSIDCTLNNTVECKIAFYNHLGQAVAIKDTVTITAFGTDSILYNRGLNTSTVGIPLSYYNPEDTLVFHIYGEDIDITERMIIQKTSYEHFESLDCPVKMFHTINDVYSSHHIIDSVSITSPIVNYTNGENIKIFLHTGD